MGKLWCAQLKLQSEVTYLNTRFWNMLCELELMAGDTTRSGYLVAAAEKYRQEYRTTKTRLVHIEIAIDGVIEYTFRRCRNPSLPPMGWNTCES